MRARIPLLLVLCIQFFAINAQVVINEASNKNATVLLDEDGDYEDWIELYNAGPDSVNLFGFGISDRIDEPHMWLFPDETIAPDEYLLLFASAKNRKPDSTTDHFESIVGDDTEWKFRIPNAATGDDWRDIGYSTSGWYSGKASIGYGDGDDSIVVPEGTVSVFLRYNFSIDDTSRVSEAILNMDFDDGFAAYLNGELIAEFGFPGGFPPYDALAPGNHEAVMYTGGLPEAYAIDEETLKSILVEGENVLAVEVHNVSPTSSDMTCKPYFFLGFKDEEITFDPLPVWFTAGSFASNLHTNFRLDGAGESVYLYSPAGILLDSIYVGWLDVDDSYGRGSDGSITYSIFSDATPDATNNLSATYTGYMVAPEIVLEAGFYAEPQITSIVCSDPTADIYYTLDGQTPNMGDLLYSAEIDIEETVTIRARCFSDDSDLLEGRVSTKTFFINEETELAVFSIVTDDENLYGADGIIDNYSTDWKRPINVEYFNEAHEPIANQYAGIKIDGGAGGSRWRPQKSFRVEPDNSVFGDGELEYPIIPRASEVTTYETFYLRNGSNQWNTYPYKDAYMVRVTEGTHNEHMAYTPVEVWLNSEYYGLYELREKLDEGHYENAHNIDKDELDLLSVSYFYGLVLRTLQGSDEEYLEMTDFIFNYPDPNADEFWDEANEKLDLYQFTDYLIGETWMANLDWPYNNIKIWRDRGAENKWKYAIIDLELGMGIGWSSVNSDLMDHLFNNYNLYTSPVLTLIENERYRNYFINRYADLMNTTFLPERTIPMEDSIYQLVLPAMPRQFQRWGAGSLASQMATFEDYREELLDDILVRTFYVRNHIQDHFDLDGKVDITLNVEPEGAGRIRISTLKIYDTPWEGVYFDGVPVQIIAEPNTGYTFSNWEDNPFIDDVLTPDFLVNFDDDTELTAVFEGSPQPELITVSEINYNSEASINAGDWIEIWNHGDYPVNIFDWRIMDQDPINSYVITEDIILNPDERWVFYSNDSLFNSIHAGVTNASGPIYFGWSNDGDKVRLITDRGDTIVDMTYNDPYPWPQGADGEGRTLELIDPFADLSSNENWFDGCVKGSPGEAYTPCMDDIVISEINYNSSETDDSDDWIELRNVSDETKDISGWSFRNNTASELEALVMPEGTLLEAGEHLVLVQTDWKFNAVHPDITNVSEPFFFAIDGNDDWLRMYDEEGVLQLSIHYQDSLPWPVEADGAGYTLELVDSSGIMNEGTNWEIGCLLGSPGEYLTLPCETANTIEDLADDYGISLYPNPANNYVIAELPEFKGITVWQLQNVSGGVLKTGMSAQNNFFVTLDDIPAGMYLLHCQTEGQVFTRSFIRQ